jgi:flagella basal body P-ring formation protein FlgA
MMARKLAVLIALGCVASTARAETLAAIIDDRAAAGLPPELAVTAVHLPRSLVALEVAPGDVDVDFPSAARPGRASVRVRLHGGRGRTVFVPVTIAAFTDIAIATRDLAPDEQVTVADVRWERRPVASGTIRASSPIGQTVNAPIAAGDVLDDARLTAPPPVTRGTEVHLAITRGAVTITTRGRLEQAARLGGPVRVRTALGTIVTGTLADRARVIVEAP